MLYHILIMILCQHVSLQDDSKLFAYIENVEAKLIETANKITTAFS